MKQKHSFIATAVITAAMLISFSSCGLLSGLSNNNTNTTNNTPTQTAPALDYAPQSEYVRGYYFTVKTSTQELTVYFEGRYSVDPKRTFINGEKTLAEYEYKDKNTAIIKYGKNRQETITLHFHNEKGGKAVYGSETGSFTFVKNL